MSTISTPHMENVFAEGEANSAAQGSAIAAELARLGAERPDLVLLSADMGAVVPEFRQLYPERYIELGIAETNTVSIAAGLAASGYVPFVLSMAPFGVLKCAEQIRTDWAYNHLPVRMIGRLSGLAMGFFGTSHHAVEDIAVARSITNLTVVSPCDANAAVSLLRSTFDHDGPVYMRVSEGEGRLVYKEPPEIGRGRFVRVREGSDLVIVGTGSGVVSAIGAAELLAKDGISAGVLDACYLKPLDEEAVLEAARTTGAILTVEEHNVVGGLGSAVGEVLARHGLGIAFAIHGLPDEDLDVGVPAALLERYGLDPQGVALRARALIGRR